MRRTIFEPEHDLFRESARRFFQNEIGPHGERWREQGCVDREAFKKAGEQGYLLMWADPNTAAPASATFVTSRS
jgi:acyl-CoA dehydrogenase